MSQRIPPRVVAEIGCNHKGDMAIFWDQSRWQVGGVRIGPGRRRVAHLAGMTRHLLCDIPGVQVLDRGQELCGIVTAWAPHWEQGTLVQTLAAENINCRISPCTAAQIDFSKKGVTWALRISPHYYNTEEEIRRCVEVLSHLS